MARNPARGSFAGWDPWLHLDRRGVVGPVARRNRELLLGLRRSHDEDSTAGIRERDSDWLFRRGPTVVADLDERRDAAVPRNRQESRCGRPLDEHDVCAVDVLDALELA